MSGFTLGLVFVLGSYQLPTPRRERTAGHKSPVERRTPRRQRSRVSRPTMRVLGPCSRESGADSARAATRGRSHVHAVVSTSSKDVSSSRIRVSSSRRAVSSSGERALWRSYTGANAGAQSRGKETTGASASASEARSDDIERAKRTKLSHDQRTHVSESTFGVSQDHVCLRLSRSIDRSSRGVSTTSRALSTEGDVRE